MTSPPSLPSNETQGQSQTELSRLLDLQKQLRREIAFTRENGKDYQEALRKLADINKKIGRLVKSLDKGRLFDEQMEIEF